MTDVTNVLALARTLSLSERTVDSPQVVAALASLKQATLAASTQDTTVDLWLSKEHMAGSVLVTAATMNKRAEQSGKGNPFNAQSRATMVSRYNAWAANFVERLEAFSEGRGDVASYLRRLAAFHADPVHVEP